MYVENTAASEGVSEDIRVAVSMPLTRLLHVCILGLVMGLVVWGVSFVLETYVLRGMLCQGNEAMQCAPASIYGQIAATIAGAIIGLMGLVKLQVFRPLVVVLAATVGLWSVVGTVEPLAWYWALLTCMLMYAGAYALFTWIARIRLFWLMILVAFILVAALRFALTV